MIILESQSAFLVNPKLQAWLIPLQQLLYALYALSRLK